MEKQTKEQRYFFEIGHWLDSKFKKEYLISHKKDVAIKFYFEKKESEIPMFDDYMLLASEKKDVFLSHSLFYVLNDLGKEKLKKDYMWYSKMFTRSSFTHDLIRIAVKKYGASKNKKELIEKVKKVYDEARREEAMPENFNYETVAILSS